MVDGEATVKKFQRQGEFILLESANPAIPGIMVSDKQDIRVLGVVRHIVKNGD